MVLAVSTSIVPRLASRGVFQVERNSTQFLSLFADRHGRHPLRKPLTQLGYLLVLETGYHVKEMQVEGRTRTPS